MLVKTQCFSQVSPIPNLREKGLNYESFVISQFNYCPLVWMFCSTRNNTLVNSIHERALRIAFNHYSLNFTKLLPIDGSLTIHQLNIQNLLIEIFKTLNSLNPDLMKELFLTHTSMYNL